MLFNHVSIKLIVFQDFSIFRQIEPTEYIDDLFELHSRYGTPMLEQFAALVNKEMFWVVTEVCNEHNPVRRMKIIKQFIKVASKYCVTNKFLRFSSKHPQLAKVHC